MPSQKKPSQDGGREDRTRGDRLRVRDRYGGDGLHRLDRHGSAEVESRRQREQAEAQQDALRVEPIDGDVANDERDQGAEVPERPGDLVAVVRVAGNPHGSWGTMLLQAYSLVSRTQKGVNDVRAPATGLERGALGWGVSSHQRADARDVEQLQNLCPPACRVGTLRA